MNAGPDRNPEDRALDALMAWALRQPDNTHPEKALTEEDRKALDELGPDLIEKVMSGRWTPPAPPTPATRRPRESELELAGSMNRAGEDQELSEEAVREMDRKRKELDEEEDEGQDPR